ncbi:MAG: outer membrane beta-barrel protein [Cyclobacteriaceae bacterium]
MQKIYLLAFIYSLSLSSFAQNGSISGKVIDYKTKEGLIGANVVIQGTSVGAATDIDGGYLISNLKPGTYNLSISSVTYKSQTVQDVVVESGKITSVEITLVEDVAELQEVVVTATREVNNDVSLMKGIQEAKLVVSGISSEQIVKLPDGDAAQVMKRVPGITIVDNRFVLVRGIPERYNQVMINNAIAPSTEVDKRSFSFDLIPSSSVDQLLIYKSGTAELPGDFAGGVIQVVTKSTSNEEYTSLGLNVGYRANTTFGDFYKSKGSSTDFLGFDNGFRSLPSNFPTTEALKTTSQLSDVREKAGKSLENNFDISKSSAFLDHGISFGIARNLNFGKIKASNLTNISYSRGFMTYDAGYIRYGSFDANPATVSDPIYNFVDKYNVDEAKINVTHNWLFNLNSRNKIEFKNIFAQLGEDRTILRTGTDVTSLPGNYNNNAYHYISRSIYSGQLQGNFVSPNGLNSFKVLLGLNYLKRNEPDFRRFRRIEDTPGNYRMILPPSANLFDAGRFYSNLTDVGYSNGLSFEHRFKKSEEKRVPILKAGYYVEYKTRQFDARYVSYLYPGSFSGQVGDDLSKQSLATIFSPANIFTRNSDGTIKDGLNIQEGSRDSDSYKGKNLLTAAYSSITVPVGKFDLSGGLRVERNDQQLIYKSSGIDSTIVNLITSPLPFANIAYNISDRSLLRIAYSRTINRPEFREIAPFLFYQFEYNLNIQGKRNLKVATIDNIDLRWEIYPNPGEAISLGAFYKSFKDPIEFAQVNASGNLQFSYQNAPQAYSYGLELEIRKSLSSLGVSKFLRNTSFNLNTSVIKSEVDMGQGVVFQQRFRPLQGQSPYVVNLGAYYNDPDLGYSVNLGYNIFGNRIFSVGSVLYPGWIERPRHSVDLQIAKTIKRMEIKLNVQNLLDAQYRFYQDNDENQQIDEKIDDPIQQYRTGAHYTLSVSWKFLKK